MRMTPWRRLPAVALLGSALACGGDTPLSPTEAVRVAQAEARWAREGPAHYTIEMRRVCFCPPQITAWATIEVRSDTVIAATFLTGDTVPTSVWYARPPVSRLFDEIRTYRPSWLEDIEVDFDAATGYPTRIRFRSDDTVADGGLLLESRNLVSLR